MPDEPYRVYFLRARLRWLRAQTVTAAQLRSIYKSAADDTASTILAAASRVDAATGRGLSIRHLEPLLRELDALALSTSEDVLAATLNGIELSVDAATAAARAYGTELLSGYFSSAGLRAAYQNVNSRAVIAFATRTRGDGLRLSDRVWRIARAHRGEVRRFIEHAVTEGKDARTLAKQLQQHLRPGTHSPHSPAVRRRLNLSSKIDWRAMRLARNEMGDAFREGTILSNSATPSYLGARWEISGSHPITDECDDLASGGDGSGFYVYGSEPSAPHPQCMCALVPEHQSDRAFEARLHRWLDDPSSEPRLEQWHRRFAQPFFTGRPIEKPGRGIIKAPARDPITVSQVDRAFDRLRKDLADKR